MSENLQKFIPNGLGVVGRVDCVNFKNFSSQLTVYFIKVFCDQKLNDENVLFHVPATGMFLSEIGRRRFDQPL